ncbi:MAG: htrA [Cytophagaceae bacterium]|jgi:Do/DeqQ family serine protease|nr:htrA [Cytophagaceae bacterium]
MKKYLIMIGLSIASGCLGSYLFQKISPAQDQLYTFNSSTQPAAFANYHSSSDGVLNTDFVAASAASTPSVVYITTMANSSSNGNWMDWFFNGGNQNTAGSGSGIIFSKDGYIVTNNHVIESADKIEVMHNRKSYAAKLVGLDPSTDLAVLKIEGTNLPAIKVGNSTAVRVGEWVLAVGNPFNLTSTVTAGIVSAKGRNLNLLSSQFPIESFIQTDAAINPGNSGGALVNLKGELIGVNTAIYSRTGSYTGYGFAVPVDIVKKVVTDLIQYGIVQKAFAGIDVAEVNSSLADKHQLQGLNGVVITSIQSDGSSATAGLKVDDVILKINDIDITSKSMYDEALSYYSPGDKLKITYKRDTRLLETTLQLTNKEGTTSILKNTVYTSELLGADMEPLSKVERDKMNLKSGVVLGNVHNGLIRRLGLQKGFIITGINNQPIHTPKEIEDILSQIKGRVIIEGYSSNGGRAVYSYYF